VYEPRLIFCSFTADKTTEAMMNIQYISNHKGCTAGVFIPIEEWEPMREQLGLPEEPQYDEDGLAINKAAILANVREALEEVKLYKQGKIKLQSARDFLKELEAENEL